MYHWRPCLITLGLLFPLAVAGGAQERAGKGKVGTAKPAGTAGQCSPD